MSANINDFSLKLNDTEIVESKQQFENSKNKEFYEAVFGNLTKEVIMAFQKKYGLTRNGIVDSQTWALVDTIDAGENDTNARATLCFSSTGEDVEYVQRRLNGIGFGSLVVDGIFGVATESAVNKFQKYYGLTANGIVGSQTWNKLESIDV
ncbi:MAG: peptidoglycan-binding protein [Cyanobacteria bacterium P01_H01_bin.35]